MSHRSRSLMAEMLSERNGAHGRHGRMQSISPPADAVAKSETAAAGKLLPQRTQRERKEQRKREVQNGIFQQSFWRRQRWFCAIAALASMNRKCQHRLSSQHRRAKPRRCKKWLFICGRPTRTQSLPWKSKPS